MPFSQTQTNDIVGRRPTVSPNAQDLASQRFTIDLATGDLAANATGQVGWLPAGCVPVDVHIDGTDMDSSTAALILAVGIGNAATAGAITDLSTAAADGGGEWGRTVAVNTAFHQRIVPTLRNMLAVLPSSVDRPLAVRVITPPTTAVAGTLGVTLFYRNA